MTFEEMQDRTYQIACDHGFHSIGVSDLERMALIASEVGEAIECLRDPNYGPCDVWYRDSDGKPEGFPMELADIVIRAMDVAATRGINLAECVIEKMAFNASRPHLHGKRC